MNSITPRQYLPIVKQIADPLDTTTYYVRAYIYKCIGNDSPSLIDTVDLVDKGGQRFTYQYQTPADVSGEGYFLSIIIKTFTDSGHTSESPNYAVTETRYKVIERVQHFGGGTDINYKKVRKIIKDEISKRKIAKVEKISLDPIINELKNLKKEDKRMNIFIDKLDNIRKDILNIKIPEQDNSFKNLEERQEILLKQIQKIQKQIKDVKIPQPEKLDLSPVISMLKTIQGNSDSSFKKILEQFKGFTGFFLNTNDNNLLKRLTGNVAKSKSKIRI